MSAKPKTTSAERSDMPSGHWIDRHVPPAARPYLRLARIDRPIGWFLLMWPCWFGVTLAAAADGMAPDPYLLLLFLVGAVAMRGAGCTYNDIVDKDIDARVARTVSRPIANGDLSVRQGLMLLGGLCLAGLGVLVQLGQLAILLGLAALALVAVYPFMKRITYWPQAWLGLTFNWGALLGWAAATGELGWPALWLYLGGVAWTLGYDTIYAHQDKEDDELIGVKSAALKLGEATVPALFVFYVATVGCWAAAGAASGVHWAYLLGVGAVAVHLAWQVQTLDIHDHRDCLAKFKSNRFVGALLFAGMLLAGAAA